VCTQPPPNINKCVAQGVDKLLGPTPRTGEVSPASAHKLLVPESMAKLIYNVADKAAESIPNSANPATGGSKTASVGRYLQDSSARRRNQADTNMLLHSHSQLHAQPLRSVTQSAVGLARHQNARPASTSSMAINAYLPAPSAAPAHPRVLQVAARGASGPPPVVESVHYKYAQTRSGGRAQSADTGQIFTLDRSFLC
jgi:hypothetical protein